MSLYLRGATYTQIAEAGAGFQNRQNVQRAIRRAGRETPHLGEKGEEIATLRERLQRMRYAAWS